MILALCNFVKQKVSFNPQLSLRRNQKGHGHLNVGRDAMLEKTQTVGIKPEVPLFYLIH
ncbi:hypothetical protein SK32_00550 [Citrobacter sp. MGH100]|nr:hypothetical protein SK32_00550 [Citrobacter sp. MGH100]